MLYTLSADDVREWREHSAEQSSHSREQNSLDGL